MAAVRVFIICLCLIVTVLLGYVEGKRGGGSRSSSRGRTSYGGSSSSGGSYRSSRTYNVALSGRIVTGNSGYTSSNWRTAAAAGMIYGGLRHSRMHSHDRSYMPPICTNRYEKSPEGKEYGYFICPKDNDTETYRYCCGPEYREYCCDMGMAQEYLSRQRKDGISIGAICGIVISIAFIIAISIFCCKKRKQAGIIIRKFSKKGKNQQLDMSPKTESMQLPGYSKDGHRNAENMNGIQQVPLNEPVPSFAVSSPGLPPPPYSAVAAPQPGYDSSNSLPYGPPQPQPPDFYGTKSGLPPPDIGGEHQPYSAPYPPAGGDFPYQVSHDTPYPPPNGTPYPPSSGAPYPPSSGAPYPPSSGAPYPPSSGAPYPPSSDAPYPPSSDAPYQPPSGAPYPPSSDAPYPSDTPYSYHETPPYPSTVASAPPKSDTP